MKHPHVLVVGAGSVGKRHATNLRSLGCTVAGVDPRADRLRELAGAVEGAAGYATVDAALGSGDRFSAVVIASPPSVHVEQGLRVLEAGLPILLEKPVAPDLAGAVRLADAARAARVPVLLGYTFRWWDPVRRLKTLVDEGAAGRPLRISMVMAAHLADWHPWERYQDFFMAQAALGGGALLDESHFLDLLVWLSGWPSSLSASIERLSALEIDTDDNVEINLGMASGARALIHLDLYSRPHQRSILVTGDRGSIEWNNEANCVRHAADAAGPWSVDTFTCQRNDMFVAEARHFLEVLDGAAPLCTLDDGVRVLQLIEAVRDSDRLGRRVAIPDPYGR